MRPARGFYGILGFGLAYILASFILNKPGFFFAALILWLGLIPPLFDLSLKRALVKRTVRRSFERKKLFADVPLRGELRVRGLFYPDVFQIQDTFSPELRPSQFLLPGWYRKSYQLRVRRGKYEVGLCARLRDRLGLFSDEVEIQDPQELTIHPSYEDIRKLELRKSRQLGKLYGPHVTRQSGLGGDFRSIREYQPTDEFRKISWKHLARYGRLMTKQYEAEKNITLLLCLDSSWTMSGGREPVTKLEYSVRACMLLAKLAEERGDNYGLVVFSDEVHYFLKPGRGRSQFYRMLDILAEVEPAGEKSLSGLADFIRRSSRRSCLVILLSDLETDVEELKEAVKELRAGGHNILIICPFTPRFELESREEPLSTLQDSLLDQLELDHRRMDAELNKLGVDCIRVGPQEFLPKAMKAVLDKKRLGLAAT